MALTANNATIARVYVSVECPARLDTAAHDTTTSGTPAMTAAMAQYWWIQPRNRGLAGRAGAPSTSCAVSSMALGRKRVCPAVISVLSLTVPSPLARGPPLSDFLMDG